MTPRLVCVYFDAASSGQFSRLAEVLRWTAAQHCPTWDRAIDAIPAPTPPRRKLVEPAHLHNTEKLDRWVAAVDAAPDGQPMLLIDADTAILRPLDDVWQQPFDVAITVREPGCRLPLNAGVVFVRATAAARALLRRWRDINRQMVTDHELHREWKRRYGGLNQAALGCAMSERAIADLALLRLPCLEWNCEDSSWSAFDPARTRILHVKSLLRKVIFRLAPAWPEVKPLTRLWLGLERQALEGRG